MPDVRLPSPDCRVSAWAAQMRRGGHCRDRGTSGSAPGYRRRCVPLPPRPVGTAPRPSAPAACADESAGRKMRRSEEHTSELQSLMRISYAVFCLKKKNKYIPCEYQIKQQVDQSTI